MNENLKNFDCKQLSETKDYNNIYDRYLEKKEKELQKEIKRKFTSIWDHIVFYGIVVLIAYFIISNNHDFEDFAVLSAIFYGISLLINKLWKKISGNTQEKLIKKGLKELRGTKEQQKNRDHPGIDKDIVVSMCFGKDSKLLGRAFTVKHNKVTGQDKREYYGYVYIVFPQGKEKEYTLAIYANDDDMVCLRPFLISDIVAFKVVSAEGLGPVKNASAPDMERLRAAERRHVNATTNAAITNVRSEGSINSALSNASRQQSMINEARVRHEIESEMKKEEQRIHDETFIKLLQFNNNDTLLISHLNMETVADIESAID